MGQHPDGGKRKKVGKDVERRAGLGPSPGPTLVFFPVGIMGELGEHPAVDGPVLDVHYMLPGRGRAIARLPLAAWPAMRDNLDELYKAAEEAGQVAPLGESDRSRASKAGLHLPGGPDIDAVAEAQRKLRDS